MTYREKFAILDKENKSPIEDLFARYYNFQFSGDLFCDYDKCHISKEKLISSLLEERKLCTQDNDIEIINNYKKDDDLKEHCVRIYNLIQNLTKCDTSSVEKLRKLFINAQFEDYNYIIRSRKRAKFRKNIKRKRGK